MLLLRLVAHPLAVEHPEDRAADPGACGVPAQEQVGGDVQGRAHGEVLVDRLDAGGLGVVGLRKWTGWPSSRTSPGPG